VSPFKGKKSDTFAWGKKENCKVSGMELLSAKKLLALIPFVTLFVRGVQISNL
jgi:hypothetical protein